MPVDNEKLFPSRLLSLLLLLSHVKNADIQREIVKDKTSQTYLI
jgi:hypothetical protein